MDPGRIILSAGWDVQVCTSCGALVEAAAIVLKFEKVKRTLKLFLLLFLFVGCGQKDRQFPARKDIVETVYASGKILPDSEYTACALNQGLIVRKLVKTGDLVDAGAPLYLLDNKGPAALTAATAITLRQARRDLRQNSAVLQELRAAVGSAELRYKNDSLTYDRYRNLWSQNIGTRVNLDRWQTQYQISLNDRDAAREKYRSTFDQLRLAEQQAVGQTANARAELSQYLVRAAASGMVYQTLKEAGEAVRPNEALALLGKKNNPIIRLDVDQQDISRLQPRQLVLLKSDVSGDRVLTAHVVRIYPVMNEADQTFRVEAVFDSRPSSAFIHCSVEANIVIRRKHRCLIIPSSFLLSGNQVMILQDGQKKRVTVRTGIRNLEAVEILSGLNEHSELLNPDRN